MIGGRRVTVRIGLNLGILLLFASWPLVAICAGSEKYNRQQLECILKLAGLPTIPNETEILGFEKTKDESVSSYRISFRGSYGTPEQWWKAAPDSVSGEAADWESCEAKGEFESDASCLELKHGHLIVEESLRKITVVVDVGEGDKRLEQISACENLR